MHRNLALLHAKVFDFFSEFLAEINAPMYFFSCWTFQDPLVLKPPKKSPLLLRTSVLIFSVVCGIFIFSICLKQISHARVKFLEMHVVERPSQHVVNPTDFPYLHYPMPVSFSR